MLTTLSILSLEQGKFTPVRAPEPADAPEPVAAPASAPRRRFTLAALLALGPTAPARVERIRPAASR